VRSWSARAHALRILPVPGAPDLARAIVEDQTGPALPGPEEGHPVRFALDDLDRMSFAATAIEMRFLEAGR
jgi:hypothetical protein